MLLATNEFKNWHDCIYEDPFTVDQIASSENMRIEKERLAARLCEYKMKC